MLYETKTAEIPLTQELEYIEKYIQLQKIRTANPNFVHYELSGDPRHKKIAPMVFIPFIENAFKHSGNKKIDQAVNIDFQIGEQAIVFKCANKFEPHRSAKNGHNGLGNELIQKRLTLLYPEKHTLTVDRQNDQYQIELTILNGKV
jgi:LytS/YehU family sensor histidine kinase